MLGAKSISAVVGEECFFYFQGIPTYLVASLLEMSDWGGTDAESLKNAIDHIFEEQGSIPIDNYGLKLVSVTANGASIHTGTIGLKLVSVTADGASVNTGKISGLITRFADNRDWLVRIHCVNHRIELAVKDAFANISKLKDIDEFYRSNFYLLRDSGKIKGEIEYSIIPCLRLVVPILLGIGEAR